MEGYSEVIQELLEDVSLGETCRNFLTNTEVGRYLISQAAIEEHAAYMQWQQIDPSNAEAIRECQFQAQTPSRVVAWLRDAITKGADANQQIAMELEEMNDGK